MEEFDLIVKDSTIVDGSGKSAFKGSLAFKGDKVASVGSVKGDTKKVIDASGLIAIPGFIDSHSHADTNLLFFPKCENYALQGVTTFVGGMCGITPAPIKDMIPLYGRADEYIDELIQFKYYPEKTLFPREKVNQLMKEHFGWTINWETMGDFFKVVEKKGISVNYIPFVGHGTIRELVMGEDFKRDSTNTEKAEMASYIKQGLDDGCIGLSAGLDYDPDVFASREELVGHISLLKEYNGIFCPHSRRTGRRRDVTAGQRVHNKIDGINEVIDLCRATGVKLNIAHLYTGWYITPTGGPYILEEANCKATLMVIDAALKEGLDISFDVLPSALSSPYGGSSYLCTPFLPWLREAGSREEFAKKLKIKDYREELKEAINRGKWYMRIGPANDPKWAEHFLIVKHKNTSLENRSIAEIAEEQKKDPFDTWLDLLIEDPDARYPQGEWYAPLDYDAPYYKTFYEHPLSAVGLDTGVVDYKWERQTPPWSTPGITQYSAFVGFVDKYVNRLKVFTLEQAVQKTSTQAAINYRLKGRGVIKEGSYADIVLMDLPNLKVMGTPLDSRRQPRGIEYVFVNGVAIVDKSKHTNKTPGRVLKRE